LIILLSRLTSEIKFRKKLYNLTLRIFISSHRIQRNLKKNGMKKMKIIVDVMGSDLGPAEIIKGAVQGAEKYQIEIILVGDKTIIDSTIEKYGKNSSGITVVNADDEIKMTDDPMSVRTKPNSSMRVALDILSKGQADALVSCGNTGALQTGATLYAKRIKGVYRAAIGAVMPLTKPLLLLDSGANISVTPEFLLQFAIMGSVYMEKRYNIESAKVGLLNIGTESHKGTSLQTETYDLLKNSKYVNFVGNIEGKDIPFGACDVLITDGFTGNVCLKTTEGTASYLVSLLKQIFKKNIRTKLAYLLVKDEMSLLKSKMSSKTQGGAPILGISHPVIKAHGNSDADAIENAIKQAIIFSEGKIIEEITDKIAAINSDLTVNQQN
jgi:phosphate acyltransferase